MAEYGECFRTIPLQKEPSFPPAKYILFRGAVNELSPGSYYLQRRFYPDSRLRGLKYITTDFYRSPGCRPNQTDRSTAETNLDPGAGQGVVNGDARAASQRRSDSQLLQPLPYSPCPGRKRDCRLARYITPRPTPLQCLLYLQAFRSTETAPPVAGAWQGSHA